MAASTNSLALNNSWASLGPAAQLIIQAVGGPIEIWVSSSGAPSANVTGMFLFPGQQPFVTFPSTGIVYATASAGAPGVGVLFANAS